MFFHRSRATGGARALGLVSLTGAAAMVAGGRCSDGRCCQRRAGIWMSGADGVVGDGAGGGGGSGLGVSVLCCAEVASCKFALRRGRHGRLAF